MKLSRYALPAIVLASAAPLLADDGSSINLIDTLWVLVAAFLVFFMNAGFAFVETGFCRAKNAVNILAKNFSVLTSSGVKIMAARGEKSVFVKL